MMLDISGKIQVGMFGCVSYPEGGWHGGRRLGCHLLLYLSAGELSMQIGQSCRSASRGEVLFVEAGEFYRPLASGGCSYYFFHFTAERCRGGSTPFRVHAGVTPGCEGFAYSFGDGVDPISLSPHMRPASPMKCEEALAACAALRLGRSAGEKRRLDALFRLFLAELAEEGKEEALSSQTEAALAFLEGHLAEPLSLRRVAEHLHFSPSYVARRFQRELGESVGEYVLRRRLELAGSYLLHTELAVSQIAELCGFRSPYYFSTRFRERYGCTPLAYRRGIRKQKENS